MIEPALVRVRANATALLFAVPFAAALLTNILWMQHVWHYSAIKVGFAIAPGPLMVPIFAAVAHRLAARIPIGLIVAVGCILLGAGALITSMSVGAQPDYAGAILPAARAATGSAVVNMNRQLGTALGVSLVVAALGVPVGYSAAHAAFQHTWWTFAAVAVLAAVAAPRMTRRTAAAALETNHAIRPSNHPDAVAIASGAR